MRKFNKQTIYNSNGSFVMSDTQKHNVKVGGYVWNACFLILFAAKVFGFATYSWWVVFSPYLILLGLVLFILIIWFIMALAVFASSGNR